MKFVSTRDKNISASLSEAIQLGIAPNKGLFVPNKLPQFELSVFNDFNSIEQVAQKFLLPFFKNDPLEEFLFEICQKSFTFDIPMVEVDNNISVLELYHGPTAAFKDVGARFLANCFANMKDEFTILVATSGDTGSAVASAFFKRSNVKAVILYPEGKISDFQESQLTYWNDNIQPLKVKGDFDACQRLVKEAFSDKKFKDKFNLTSANSINIGRLLPQCVYYVYSSLEYYREHQKEPNFVIPTGNMGNVLAAIWTKLMGFPINQIIMTTNANRVIPDYFQTGKFEPRTSIRTLANAMDVGQPSNLERFIHLQKEGRTQREEYQTYSVPDAEIIETVRWVENNYSYQICPHTATAFSIIKAGNIDQAVVVATAHPYKFLSELQRYYEPAVMIPPNLEKFNKSERYYKNISPSLDNLKAVITQL